jgi:hypothetical protein
MYVQRNIETFSRKLCCRGKAIINTYYEYVLVALVTWPANRMRHIILSPVACVVMTYFSTLSHIRHVFLERRHRI